MVPKNASFEVTVRRKIITGQIITEIILFLEAPCLN
jgi:hypothetical protein